MSETKESLSSFVEKIDLSSEYDKILSRNVLVAPTEKQYELLLKRLKQQLGEGRGEVILEVFNFILQSVSCRDQFFSVNLINKRDYKIVFFKIGGSPDGSDNGLLEDEVEAAIATLQSLANTLECSCVKLRERKEMRGVVLQYLIRRMLDQSGKCEHFL